MKLRRLENYLDFIEAVQSCESDVYFNSCEGDHLNLKSVLSQFLFAAVCSDHEFLEQGSVECKKSEDYGRLRDFLCEKDIEMCDGAD